MARQGRHFSAAPARRGGQPEPESYEPPEYEYDTPADAPDDAYYGYDQPEEAWDGYAPEARYTEYEPYARAPQRRLWPVWKLVALDALCIAVGLCVFALFHHVIDLSPAPTPIVLPTATPAPTPEPTPVPEVTPEPTPERVYSGVWGEKFDEFFTEGEVVQTETSYQSENINVTYSFHDTGEIQYRVADIYVSDLKYLRVGFSNDTYGTSADPVKEFASYYQPIVALSGDYYLGRREGVVVRNSVLYREKADTADLCVLYEDGTMKCMPAAQLDIEAVKQGGVYQIWTFGPLLLVDGQPATTFNSTVRRANPRSAIGYVEPGHYIFVQVDGRISASRGMTLAELAQLFFELGCVEAYNLDGGASSAMIWQSELVSYAYGRPLVDMIYVAELPEETAQDAVPAE